MMDRLEQIKLKLKNGLNAIQLKVEDQSHLHANHNDDAKAGGTHYKIFIISRDFIGKNQIERHKMIYHLLDEEFANGLHALSIEAKPDV